MKILIPIEVKANNNPTNSLNNLINSNLYKDIKFDIKLCNKNIGFNEKILYLPLFLNIFIEKIFERKIV